LPFNFLSKVKKSINCYACIIYYAYICDMNNIKFLQQKVFIYKGEDPVEYMIIIEYDTITSLPIHTYIVQVPQQYLAFFKYHFISN